MRDREFPSAVFLLAFITTPKQVSQLPAAGQKSILFNVKYRVIAPLGISMLRVVGICRVKIPHPLDAAERNLDLCLDLVLSLVVVVGLKNHADLVQQPWKLTPEVSGAGKWQATEHDAEIPVAEN
jgi:hypothetical protein